LKKLFLILGSCFVFAVPIALGQSANFHLASSTWREGGSVPRENVFDGAGCGGGNVSPELHWSGAPGDTKSFAITIFDPDAPGAGRWWHWVIFNIPVTVSELPAGAGSRQSRGAPAASVQCRNDFGGPGYGGPCPPAGTTHRYVAKVYALNVEKLPLGSEIPPAKAAKQIEAHSIGTASLTVKFGR
jgi:Raf kinase inhibitor-like YbhB/YbcL family protein